MKKSLFMAFMLFALATSAYAQCRKDGNILYCKWNAGDDKCWAIAPDAGKNCSARVEECEKNSAGEWRTDNPLTINPSANGKCDGTPTQCRGCTGITESSTGKFCDHGTCVEGSDPYGCTDKGCYPINEGDNGCPTEKVVTSCPACSLPPANRPAGTNCGNVTPSSTSTQPSSGSGGVDPIISYNSTTVTGLNVTHFANSLQIASGKDATVFLFDIRGKQMFSQKVLSGTTTISLAGQRQGVYYAVVKAGAQKQTVKIILK